MPDPFLPGKLVRRRTNRTLLEQFLQRHHSDLLILWLLLTLLLAGLVEVTEGLEQTGYSYTDVESRRERVQALDPR